MVVTLEKGMDKKLEKDDKEKESIIFSVTGKLSNLILK